MRYFLPRVSRERLLLGAVAVLPAVLLGALANALVTLELARLDLVTQGGILDLEAIAAFKWQAESLMIGAFVIAALGVFAVIHADRSAMTALSGYAVALLVLLGVIVAGRWDLGLRLAAARIGLGTALWGLAWAVVAMQLLAFLAGAPHRRWLWATAAVSLLFFVSTFLVFVVAWLFSVEVAAVASVLGGGTAAVFTLARRSEIEAVWALDKPLPRLPVVAPGQRPLVIAYVAIVFALMGAAYQHHFDYRPVQSLGQHLMMMAASVGGAILFGLLAWHGGRRALLWAVPGATGAAVLLQAGFVVRWPAAVAVGFMLGVVFYLFQYLLESLQRGTRMAVALFGLGAVAMMAAGGSIVAQVPALAAFTPERVLVLQVAALLAVFLLTPQLPETHAAAREEEALEEYLELARRVQEEHQ